MFLQSRQLLNRYTRNRLTTVIESNVCSIIYGKEGDLVLWYDSFFFFFIYIVVESSDEA